MANSKKQSWALDQLAKREFFHQKLHQWALLDVADAIESVQGETLTWDRAILNISDKAWNKIIHRGIKPVIVFAHSHVLTTIPRSTGYYRMLAMVSQKSMNQIGLASKSYEDGRLPDEKVALTLAQRLNKIISTLIEADEEIDGREFILWRGMAAGSQAQGSWQNTKGRRTEIILPGIIKRRLRNKGWIDEGSDLEASRFTLRDDCTIYFSDEPDIALYKAGEIVTAVEIKGGIDKAGVLERVGAAIKSLSRAKVENPDSLTLLILQAVSMTPQSKVDLETNQASVNHWLTVEEILENEAAREQLFNLLGI